jgi:integrase/transcription elongation factor Elf1
MIEVNWKQDYHGEFICLYCNKGKMGLRGYRDGKRKFRCKDCQRCINSSINLNRRSAFLESRLKGEQVDWEKDYQGEFLCPKCQTIGISVCGIRKLSTKRLFRCSACRHTCLESCHIKIQAIADPSNLGTTWYTDHRIKGFVCPKCQAQNVYFTNISKQQNKKRFQCRSCRSYQYESIHLTRLNISHYSGNIIPVKPFDWLENEWDLRAINPNFDQQDLRISLINFSTVHPDWFKQEVKRYIQYLCKAGYAFAGITSRLSGLRSFSHYLNQVGIANFQQINRSLVLDYLAQEKQVNKGKVGNLRSFFTVGTLRGWFNIDPDIIRNEDYPRQRRSNPDPLSDSVCEQIEQNLHQLPDPIARMWLICYFAAMRPSELALLKQDCLVQEGEHWKLVWQRKKTNDYHEVPISRTIAKVVQEQQEYIQNLWGDEWDYLFCHYHRLSSTDIKQPNLEPVKKVIPTIANPLILAIRCLIQAFDIRNENGQLAEFSPKLLRPTRLTQLFEQGHDLSVVSAWAGHKHFATTTTYYTFVSCELMEREAGHIQQALVNSNGQHLPYESLPKSFWRAPQAHKLEVSGTHINTPIYGFCGLPLDQDCHKFRACYTCSSFVAVPEKLPQYILTRDELRKKQSNALVNGQDVLVEQFGLQADQLDKIIAGLQEAA